jgi:hypothetical protein
LIIPDDGRTCIATGLSYSNCFDANSAPRVEGRCPTTRVRTRNAATGETKGRNGSQPIEFHLNCCFGGR